VLLSGLGADELFAGYGRHRTTFKTRGWAALQQELDMDLGRIWRRNLGRDDRLVTDHGREARHPYLDERLLRGVAELPLPLLCDLRLAPGEGDKRALRQVAAGLGLVRCGRLVKRAMQFGTRIANNHVAGYARMGATVALEDIVNPRFLVHQPIGGPGELNQEELARRRHQRKLAKKQDRLDKKKASADARRAGGYSDGGGSIETSGQDTNIDTESTAAQIPNAPRRPIEQRLSKKYNYSIGKPGYEGSPAEAPSSEEPSDPLQVYQ
jgi:asparagine synthetase B (glutamine-hydrolysing)